MLSIIDRFKLNSGSQGGQSELYVLEKLLEHYRPGHTLLDNPKFQHDPENPTEVYIQGNNATFATTVTTVDPTVVGLSDCETFPYVLPLTFCT